MATELNNKHFRLLFEAVGEPVLLVSLGIRHPMILQCNKAATRFFGHTETELATKSVHDLTAEGSRAELALFFEDLLVHGLGACQLKLKDSMGHPLEVALQGTHSRKNGSSRGLVVVIPKRSSHTDSAQLRQERVLRRLSTTAAQLVEMEPDDDIFRVIAEAIHQIIEDGIVWVTSSEGKNQKLKVEHIVGLGRYLKRVSSLLGDRILGYEVEIAPEKLSELTSGTLTPIKGGVYELSFGRIPRPLCLAIEKILGVQEIWGMGFARRGVVYGSAMIALRRGHQFKDRHLLKAFIHLASVALHRKRAAMALRESRRQLNQAQKMEAVGRLAGGIAHDFNNLLTVITGHTDLLKGAQDSLDAPLVESVQQIAAASERAASLVRHLLSFSRPDDRERQAFDLNETLSSMRSMIRRLLSENIQLEVKLAPHRCDVYLDQDNLQQVVMNLVVNANDAMPKGGALTITTRLEEVQTPKPSKMGTMLPGRYECLCVADTGEGMDAITGQRIFEPFYTTKEKGKGTGLGLSTVYGIIKNAGGHITLKTSPGEGSQFDVFLPCGSAERSPSHQREPENRARESSGGNEKDRAPVGSKEATRAPAGEGTGVEKKEKLPHGASGSSPTDSKTILVAEDQPQLRELVQNVLAGLGHRLLMTADGDEALAKARNHPGPIHLLLTDMVMPNRSGVELAKELLKSSPDVKIIFMTGYSDDRIPREEEASHTLLQKPFSVPQLLDLVEKTLQD